MSILSFLNFFNKLSDTCLDPNVELNPLLTPVDLLNQINPRTQKAQCKKFIQKIRKQTKNGARTIRSLTVLHLLIIYSNEFYDVVESCLPLTHQVTDKWLINCIINPYTTFLQKCVSSRQMHSRCKTKESMRINFENTFYLINLLTQLFTPVQKMSLLGRYYKQSNAQATCAFIQTIAVQAQILYINFSFILTEMISFPHKYIQDRSGEKIIKSILSQSLIQINEQMKKLFLDKYFYPYGKGVIVKLFRLQDQTDYNQKVIKGIITDHQQTERKNQYVQLERTLFPKEGQFNFNFYEKSLMQTIVITKQFQQQVQDISEDPQFGFDDTLRGQQKQNFEATQEMPQDQQN